MSTVVMDHAPLDVHELVAQVLRGGKPHEARDGDATVEHLLR